MADAQRTSAAEGSKRANPAAEVLHQRRGLPYSRATMALGGVAIVGAVWYFTTYAKKKREASAGDVAGASAGIASPEERHPRK